MYPYFILIAQTEKKEISPTSFSQNKMNKSSKNQGQGIYLSSFGIKQSENLKKIINFDHIERILISPQVISLQTAYYFLKDQHKNIQIYIQGKLGSRVKSTDEIQDQFLEFINQNKNQLTITQINATENWFYDVLSETMQTKIEEKKQNLGGLKQSAKFLLKQIGELESRKQFYERIQNFKQNLLMHHAATKKKIAIIASSETLQYLSCTSYLKNYQAVNGIVLESGNVSEVPIIIKQVSQEIPIPFCT